MPVAVREVLMASFIESMENAGLYFDSQFYELAPRLVRIDRVQEFIDSDLRGLRGEALYKREQFHVRKLRGLAMQYAKIVQSRIPRTYPPGGVDESSYQYVIMEAQAELKAQFACDMYPCSG